MSQKFLPPKKNRKNPKASLLVRKANPPVMCFSFCGFFFAEVEGGILGLLQLPAGQAAVCQLAKTAEEVVNSVSCFVDEMVYLEEESQDET